MLSKVDTPLYIANKIRELVRPSAIAETLEMSPAEFEPLLAQAVVLGHIHRSEILFTFPQSIRDDVEVYHVREKMAPAKLRELFQITATAVDDCENNFLCALIRQRVVYSDLYEIISQIETTLHNRIRQCLEEAFRKREGDWWNKGVPLAVRKSCATRREEDENPSDDLYSYTTLIDLKAIIEAKGNGSVFSERLPAGARKDQQLPSKLFRLNVIRNRVMHSVRADEPLGEAEYRFVSQMHNILVTSPWNLKTN